MDAFILPALATIILVLLIYIGTKWLKNPQDRALGHDQLEKYEEETRKR